VEELMREYKESMLQLESKENFEKQKEEVLKEMTKNYPFFDPNFEFNLNSYKKKKDYNMIETTYFEDNDNLQYQEYDNNNEDDQTNYN